MCIHVEKDDKVETKQMLHRDQWWTREYLARESPGISDLVLISLKGTDNPVHDHHKAQHLQGRQEGKNCKVESSIVEACIKIRQVITRPKENLKMVDTLCRSYKVKREDRKLPDIRIFVPNTQEVLDNTKIKG